MAEAASRIRSAVLPANDTGRSSTLAFLLSRGRWHHDFLAKQALRKLSFSLAYMWHSRCNGYAPGAHIKQKVWERGELEEALGNLLNL